MQLRKNALVLCTLGALSLSLMACGDDAVTGAGCTEATAATDCQENEICHPTALVCVTTCDSAVDCSDNAKTCAPVSASNSTKICKCSTTALCNKDRETADLVCLPTERVCAPEGSGGGGGGGEESCTGEGQSSCDYGSFCDSSACVAVAFPPTCENFSGSNTADWNVSTDNGPVIYSLEQTSFATNTSDCVSDAPVGLGVKINAYRPDTDWPSSKNALPNFLYVRVNGSEVSVTTSLLRDSGYTHSGKNAEFKFTVCLPSTATTASLGFYFTNGNEVCQQFNR